MTTLPVKVSADFNALSDYPEDGIVQGIPLGYVVDNPKILQALVDMQPVILAAPDIFTEGYIRRIPTPEGDYSYGVVNGAFHYYSEVKERSPIDAKSRKGTSGTEP